MKQKQKKINYCRLSLHGGVLDRMELTKEDRLTGAGGGSFSYLAPVFDTADIESTFHRFLLKGEFRECKFEVIAAATDTDISDSIFREGILPQEQKEVLKQLKHVRAVNKKDFLLHELTGRYLWIYLGVSASSRDSTFTIEGFQVEFPKSSFLEYFPEVYQTSQDTFFYRYMAALQTLYVELEEKVERLPVALDYETTDIENLPMFAEWVGVNQGEYPYEPTQLRYMIAHLGELQTGKGTKRVLMQMLSMITKRPVRIVEYFKWKDWMKESKELTEIFQRLYGADESVFSVIIDYTGESADESIDGQMLMGLIEEYMPLGMRCNLVYLNESCHMDTHCYLDINSRLSTPVNADTSGFMLGGNYVLG